MDTKIIAFAGKGGVGKTSLSALTVKLLVENFKGKKILAIDADPAVGLSTALGVDVTHTVNDVRLQFIDELKKPDRPSTIEILNEAHYELSDIMIDCGDFAFLAIGRPESAGCYCSINSFLKDIISELVSSFDYVVIDGEAGIEQVNRRVMEKVTDLILVSDASMKGLNVARSIDSVAKGLNMCNKSSCIINRVMNEENIKKMKADGLNVVGYILEDDNIETTDVEGNSLLSIDSNSSTMKQLKNALKNAGVI